MRAVKLKIKPLCPALCLRGEWFPMVGRVKGDKERGVPNKGSWDQADGTGVDGGDSVCGAGCE